MVLDRVVAFPESRRILRLQLLATPFIALQAAITAMIPVLLRDHFGASKWQTVYSTTCMPIMLLLSILWNELYRRVSPRRYLGVVGLVGVAPLAAIALCHRPPTLLLCYTISALGFGAGHPLAGDILRACYAPGARSRVFSLQTMISQATIMVATYGIGYWLVHDAEAFRTYIPIGVVLMGGGLWLQLRITQQPLFQERHRTAPEGPLGLALRRAARAMVAVFAADRDFRRYEVAFFIYGLGWMVCTALLPFVVVDKLKLTYEETARSTQTALQFTQLFVTLPAGVLVARLGPTRMAGIAFSLLTLYPLGLMFAGNANSLTFVTIVYAIGLTGVQLTWTLGPITLARHAGQAPHYLTIHACLVGVRALVAQIPAVLLYKLTDSLSIALAPAIVMFAVGAVLMLRLARDQRAQRRVAAEPLAAPPSPPPDG